MKHCTGSWRWQDGTPWCLIASRGGCRKNQTTSKETRNISRSNILSIVGIECGMIIWSHMDIGYICQKQDLCIVCKSKSAVHHYSNINFARKHIYNADDLCVPARSAPYYPHTNKQIVHKERRKQFKTVLKYISFEYQIIKYKCLGYCISLIIR